MGSLTLLTKLLSFLTIFFFLNHVNGSFSSFQSSFSSSTEVQLCYHEEANSLLQFKSSFFIDHDFGYQTCNEPKTESWKEGVDCCSWDGVRCDNVTGRVIDLDLGCSLLHSYFPPNSSLFLLKDLQSLNLSLNNFMGSNIPAEIGRLVNLKSLDLSHSWFSGQVPGEISHLSKLVSLSLSDFSSALILETIVLRNLVQNLSKIRELDLLETNMSSVDPCLFMNLSTSLTTLALGNLRGIFPNNIFLFPNLKSFTVRGSLSVLGQQKLLTVDLPTSNWSSPLQNLVLKDFHSSVQLSESMWDLKSLENLVLQNIDLKGSIPASLGNFSQLVHLSLFDNQLSGSIPDYHPSRLSKLSSIDIDSNLLTGTVPPWIFSLPRLKSLSLANNQLQGQICQFQHNSMEYLDLSYNELHGSIPSSIANQVNLFTLDLSSNNLSGSVESVIFSNLQSLRYLDLSKTSLSFKNGINANFTLPSLQFLTLTRCGLRNFPNFIRHATKLRNLDLSNNRIEGQIPDWTWNIVTLRYLLLSNNSFTGGLKQLSWTNIPFLDLRLNKFQGALPIPLNGTTFLLVSNNSFTGRISSDICKVDTFEILDLSHNNFSGEIPSCLHKLSKNLRVLNLQGNKFHGNVPSIFTKECRLQNLNLHGNQMEGQLPRSLVNCVELEVLDVSNNNINDTFPSWLETLTELQVLVLRFNRFHGFVSCNTKTNSSFPKLRILDLSNNDFGGPLPVRLVEKLKAIVDTHEDDNSSPYMQDTYSGYRFSVVVTMKGFTIDLENILTIFTSIDLSKNKFVGEIPNVIGKLSSLKGLNLSHNNLDGHIPPSLGDLANLEWLDLSSNKLVGKIPEELVSLTQLGTLNLSNNQLVGRIPQGKQFNTFENGSYQGNLGLCGPPISKTCGGNERTGRPPASFQDDDAFWVFNWRVVALGYGCGTVLGLFMGYLMFETGKPRCLVLLVDFYPYLSERRMNYRARRRIQRRN